MMPILRAMLGARLVNRLLDSIRAALAHEPLESHNVDRVRFGESIDRHDLAGMEQKGRKKGTLLGRAQIHRAFVRPSFEGSEE